MGKQAVDRYLNRKEVREMSGFSDSTRHRLEVAGEFPHREGFNVVDNAIARRRGMDLAERREQRQSAWEAEEQARTRKQWGDEDQRRELTGLQARIDTGTATPEEVQAAQQKTGRKRSSLRQGNEPDAIPGTWQETASGIFLEGEVTWPASNRLKANSGPSCCSPQGLTGVPEGFTGKITFHCCNGTPCVADIFTSKKIVKPMSRWNEQTY